MQRLPASSSPPPSSPSAATFADAEALTVWRVRLVRLGPSCQVFLWGERPGPVALRFDNGLEVRYLNPAPADWRECDAATLRRYCEEARPHATRRTARSNGTGPPDTVDTFNRSSARFNRSSARKDDGG
jgi:hypothetical protein